MAGGLAVSVISLLTAQIDEKTTPTDLERIRRNIVDALRELQRLPAFGARIKSNIELADGVTVHIAHGLGYKPTIVIVSPPRGATATGRIEEIRDGIEREKYIALKATGHGATITVDAEIK